MNIPFFKWQSWIEDFLNKEFLRLAMRKSRRGGVRRPNAELGQTFVKVERQTQKKILDQAKYFQQELENHQAKDQKSGKKPTKIQK